MCYKFKSPTEANSEELANETVTPRDTQPTVAPVLEQNGAPLNNVQDLPQDNNQLMEELITNVEWGAFGVNFENIVSHIKESMLLTNKEMDDFSDLMTTTFYTPRYKKNVLALKEALTFQNFTFNMQTNFFDYKGVQLDDNFINKCEMTLQWIIADGEKLVSYSPQQQNAVSYNVKEFSCRLEYIKKVRARLARTTGAEICIDRYFDIKYRIQLWLLDCQAKDFANLPAAMAELHRVGENRKHLITLQQSIINWRDAIDSGIELRDPLKTELFLDLKTRFEQLDNVFEIYHNTVAIDVQFFDMNDQFQALKAPGASRSATQEPPFGSADESLVPWQPETNGETQDDILERPETTTETMP